MFIVKTDVSFSFVLDPYLFYTMHLYELPYGKINAIILPGGTRVGDELHIVEGTPEPGIPRPAQPFRMSFRERREIVCANIFFLGNFYKK